MNTRKLKTPENTMRTLTLSPNSSVKSTTTVETRGTSYFPGCRKDTNCKCDICIESMNAVLDSLRRSSRVKIPSSWPKVPRSPVSFTSSNDDVSTTSDKSTDPVKIVRLCQSQDVNCGPRLKLEVRCGGFLLKLVLALFFILGVEYGVSRVNIKGRVLSRDLVRSLGEKSVEIEGLNRKYVFLKNELERYVGKTGVSNCTSIGSVWNINQHNSLLNTRRMLYKSMLEEVSIWGWPLQTSGLISAELSSRTFTILSGKVTEWSNVEAEYFDRRANNSWTLKKWSSSIVHLDPGTWILEYKPGFFTDNTRLITTAAEFLKFRLSKEFEKMKLEFLVPSFLADGLTYFGVGNNSVQIPT